MRAQRVLATSCMLWLRALAYMALVVGGWLIILPGLLLAVEQGHLAAPRPQEPPWLVVALACFLVGVPLGLIAGYQLIEHGRGTPFPLDPTRALVTSGPYHYVRNPQAIAMVLATAGEVAAIQSHLLWIMLPLTLMYLEALVGPIEDRQLVAKHGDAYLAYKRCTRKWLPRLDSRPAQRATHTFARRQRPLRKRR